MLHNLKKIDVGFDLWCFENVFDFDTLRQIKQDISYFQFCLIQGKRTDRLDRIWMKNYPQFDIICNHLNNALFKEFLSNITGYDYTQNSSRIELCLDKKGSWLEPHVDDPAKKFTMQIYLSNCTNSTTFVSNNTIAKENSGWFFHNTGTELHSLSPLENDRISIILNYVDNNWKDKSVLI